MSAGNLVCRLCLYNANAGVRLMMSEVKMYIAALGGPIFWALFISSTIFEGSIELFQPWILGQWAKQYLDHSAGDVNAPL